MSVETVSSNSAQKSNEAHQAKSKTLGHGSTAEKSPAGFVALLSELENIVEVPVPEAAPAATDAGLLGDEKHLKKPRPMGDTTVDAVVPELAAWMVGVRSSQVGAIQDQMEANLSLATDSITAAVGSISSDAVGLKGAPLQTPPLDLPMRNPDANTEVADTSLADVALNAVGVSLSTAQQDG